MHCSCILFSHGISISQFREFPKCSCQKYTVRYHKVIIAIKPGVGFPSCEAFQLRLLSHDSITSSNKLIYLSFYHLNFYLFNTIIEFKFLHFTSIYHWFCISSHNTISIYSIYKIIIFVYQAFFIPSFINASRFSI